MNLAQIQKAVKVFRRDFRKFAKEILKIQTKEGMIVPFRLNRVQERLWQILEEELRQGKPVRWIILKARQMGCSTFIAALMYWIVSLRSNQNAIVAAHDDDSAKNLYEKSQLFYRMSPAQFQPTLKINNRKRMFFSNPDPTAEPGLESQILVEPSENTDMGRSWTIRFFHGSEVPRWKELKDVLVSISNAMPKLPGTFQFLEGTAQGHNYFKTLWDEADKRGYRQVFISWCAFDEYTLESSRGDECPFEARLGLSKEEFENDLYDFDHDVYGDETLERRYVIEELKEWYPDLDEEGLQEESLRRLAWRRECIDKDCDRDLLKFRQEYPTIPDHAFETTGANLFPSIKLSDLRRRAKQMFPKGPSHWRWDNAKQNFYKAERGELRLYENILEEGKYIIGADPSMGVHGGDPCAAVILRLPDAVVSGVYSAVVPPGQFAATLNSLGIRYNAALIASEANDEGGYTVNDHLRNRYHYPALYRRKITDHIIKRTTLKPGWKTTAITKDSMINDLHYAIVNDEIEIYDDEIYEQLLAFQKFENGSTGCPDPMHDDVAVALMIAYQVALYHQNQVKVEQQNRVRKFSLDWWANLVDQERLNELDIWPDD